MTFDVIILVHKKDENKLKYLIHSINNNILGFDKIFVISDFDFSEKISGVTYVKDDESLILDEKTKLIWDEWSSKNSFTRQKPHWIKQQFIKLFNSVSENNYLIVDSDIIFLNNLSIIENDKPKFFFGNDQYHEEYFNFTKKLLNLDKVNNHSFISELMFFDKEIIKDFLEKYHEGNHNKFIETSLSVINNNCFISEYETYGNYTIKYFPQKYSTQKINVFFNGKIGKWEDFEIEHLLNNSDKNYYNIVSIHSWLQ